jgi:hypothetical protein
MMFVNENQFESVTSQMIKDGAVQMSDIAHGSLRGFHVSNDFAVQQNKTSGAVMSGVNDAYSANSSGLEGRGYQGVRGIGSHTGVYAEGATYGLYAKVNDSQSYALYVAGKAHCTSGDWGDLAEYVPSDETLEPGDVVIIDPDHENKIKRCTSVADRRVAGIISTAPTITVGLEKPDEETFALALAGIVPCKVVAHEPIRPGDLLTTSGTPGYAQKTTDPQVGTIVGKALENLSSGEGVIRVLVTLQ